MGALIRAKICALTTHSIWFVHQRIFKSPNLTQIDTKALAMSLTYTLETYLKLEGKKGCKLNHFRFWKIKKGLNEEISELRLMNHEKRQDEDIMSLEDEKWPLWSKKEGKKTWEMRHEVRFSCMEI